MEFVMQTIISWLTDNAVWLGSAGAIATVVMLLVPFFSKKKPVASSVIENSQGISAGGNISESTITINYGMTMSEALEFVHETGSHLRSTPEPKTDIQQREEELGEKIANSLALDNFMLFAQPIVPVSISPRINMFERFEVLIRIDDPEVHFLSPCLVMEIGCARGLAPSLDRWVISNTLRYLEKYCSAQRHVKLCTFNVSAPSLRDRTFINFIVDSVRKSNILPDIICFEITEITLFCDYEATKIFIDGVHDLGSSVALDEFGVGVSSINVLSELNIDYLKIDKVFVTRIPDDSNAMKSIRMVIGIAKSMGIRTIAVGVETEDSWRQLEILGVDFMQGYFVATPKKISELLFR